MSSLTVNSSSFEQFSWLVESELNVVLQGPPQAKLLIYKKNKTKNNKFFINLLMIAYKNLNWKKNDLNQFKWVFLHFFCKN